MKVLILREVVVFKHSQLVHLVLLLCLLSRGDDNHVIMWTTYYIILIGQINFVLVLIIFAPVLALLFLCIRPQQCFEKCDWFPSSRISQLVDFVLYENATAWLSPQSHSELHVSLGALSI